MVTANMHLIRSPELSSLIKFIFYLKQKCHVKKKDIRKFLDGIYVSDKGPISEEQ